MKAIRDEAYMNFAHMLGGNIRFCRLRKFKPQKVCAHAIGVTFQQMQKYEAGNNMPTAYRLKMIADFYKVTPNDLLDPGFIHRSTKSKQVDPTFDASKYEDFADEYPMPLSQLEHDPKMRATYDAILEDE